jgi:hypothetical protein
MVAISPSSGSKSALLQVNTTFEGKYFKCATRGDRLDIEFVFDTIWNRTTVQIRK